jgi:phage tail protein X
MRTVPRNVQVVAHDELAELGGDLPEALSVALADIAGVAKEPPAEQPPADDPRATHHADRGR